MANIREIQDRIKSINDTKKITNAMYLISSKLKRAKSPLVIQNHISLHSSHPLPRFLSIRTARR